MLGVCYYPEHWPESMWAQDAAEMRELGLEYVRIGEFAWSRIEPSEGCFEFDWLERAIQVLADHKLKVIMCTPTATPPKWLIDKHPDILPVDINTGITRGFGSRRHYDFSSDHYLHHSLRISKVLAERYGDDARICGWQTDNEIACHDTTQSGSQNAKKAFQRWCEKKYNDINALNKAWGTVFWSMEYQSFEQIELPILAVTETHPSHQLAFRQFSSDQVIHFHNSMIEVIRTYAKNQFVTHNFIPFVDTQVENDKLAAQLDFVSFDNYPLGRTDLFLNDMPASAIKPYMRTGHPDFSSYSFDQIRGISKEGFWIMEQQPGPVNWGHHNPRPIKGMVRLWSWEAFAHGAACVCFFRWRQAPFAQEQMHAGIKRNDNSKSIAWNEIEQLRDELAIVAPDINQRPTAQVAIVTNTMSQWVTEIERQGDSYNHQSIEFDYYSALRQLGINVDFITPESDISSYSLIVVPCLPIVSQSFVDKCKQSQAYCIFGPRTGSKTKELTLVPNLAPGLLQQLIPVKVTSVETIRPDCSESCSAFGRVFESKIWREELEFDNSRKDINVLAQYEDSTAMVVEYNRFCYVASISCQQFLLSLFEQFAAKLALSTLVLPKDVRVVYRDNVAYVFNYSDQACSIPIPKNAKVLLGNSELPKYDILIFSLS